MNRDALIGRLLIVAVIGGLLPLGAALWWGFELFSHFRVQYVVVALALIGIAIAFRKRTLALLLGATATINALPLLPYWPSAPEPRSGFRFEVLNVNVNSKNENYAAIVGAIRVADSDLVVVNELTPALDERLLDLSDIYPHRYARPAGDNFGIGILSRYPLNMPRAFPAGPTTALDTIVQLPAGSLRFIAAHLVPPTGPDLARTRNRQLEGLAEFAAAIGDPVLLCGDLNLTPYSPYFDRLTADAELTDVRLGMGTGFSWPSFMPLFGIPIDHCLIRGPFDVQSVERLNRIGSDHYPVKVALVWQTDQ